MIQTKPKVAKAFAGAEKYYLYVDFTSLPVHCFVLQVIHIQ